MSRADPHGAGAAWPGKPAVTVLKYAPGCEQWAAECLGGGAIVVVFASTGNAAAREVVNARLLPSHEVARADRFRRRADSEQFILARALSRLVLSHRLGIAPHAVPIVAERFRKPFVRHPYAAGLDFSITHSGGWVACCLAERHKVGVDLEPEDREVPAETEQIAARILTACEMAVFRHLDPPVRRAVFFEFWRRKEALTKAAGLGFGGGPERVAIAYQCTEGRIVWRERVAYAGRFWHLSSHAPMPGVDIALAFTYDRSNA